MKIIWINYKRLNEDLSKTSRIEMANALLKIGHCVSLVVPHTGKKLDFGLGQNMIYLPALPWKIACSFSFSISLFFYLIFSVFYRNPHIVLMDSFAFLPSLPFLILSKLRWIKTKFVLDVRTLPVETHTLRGWVKEQIHIIVLYGAKFLADGVTVISAFMKKYISNKYHIPKNKMGIWSSGVSLALFNPSNTKLVDEVNFLQDKFIIMYHGAFQSSRGLQSTIRAIKLLEDRYPDILLFLIGKGNATDRLCSLTKELDLKNKVLIHDSVPYEKMPSYISICNVGILPLPDLIEWRVSVPLKLMEYLAMEKPIIATDIEAHRGILNSSACGIFIHSSSPECIADGIIKAYKMKDKLKEIGKEGRKIVKRNYTWDRQAEALTLFLDSL
ncbi:MAG: glycosyltransferase family 4 protein [bacterium]|nr:glycosyltransferase family 4 protein [bacterium]